MRYRPSTIAGSIFSFRLISRPTLIVGSLFPERKSQILDGLTPINFANAACVSPISYILSLITSVKDGFPNE